MNEHSERQSAAGPVPASIQLEDFVEAVARGVSRALAAQDDVDGFALRNTTRLFPITIGLIAYPPGWPPYEMQGGDVLSVRR